MSDIWLLLLLLVCVGCAVQGLKTCERAYEPLLPMATVFIGFVWIQFHGLWRNDWRLPEGALAKAIFMTLLCAVGFWWGYTRKVRPLRIFTGNFHPKRLIIICLGLSLFGAGFFFLISRLPEEMLSVSQPSGLRVAYRFFAQTLSYGFALACLIWAQFGDRRALWIALFGAVFYLDRIIIAGRRADTAEFFFIIVIALFFGRGIMMPRLVMLALMVVMILAMHSTGKYRLLAKEAGWDAPFQLGAIGFVDNLVDVTMNGGEEIKNAVYMIDAYDQTGAFDYGLTHWNRLVFNYVPAQMVGANTKSSLLVDLPDVAGVFYGYRTSTGSTSTGMVDSFGSFWYFGAIKFVFIGLILRKIWDGAKSGSFGSQLIYMLLITNVLHVVTHHTHWFLSIWVHMAIFLFPLLLWARRTAPTAYIRCDSELRWRPVP
jgi:hypothetical protein